MLQLWEGIYHLDDRLIAGTTFGSKHPRIPLNPDAPDRGLPPAPTSKGFAPYARKPSKGMQEEMPETKVLFQLVFWTLMLLRRCDSSATILTLERVPTVINMTSNELRGRDQVRHGRVLQRSSSSMGVVQFPVQGGSSDPYTAGLHYTRVKLGSPPKEYYLHIDTGSDTLWVNCKSCTGCPTKSGLGIELGFFDPSSSFSSAPVPCANDICGSSCSSSSRCSYSIEYPGGGISGYYVSDVFSVDNVIGDSSTVSFSANVVLGCTNHHSGFLTIPDRAVDGVLGLGPHHTSIISQLAAQGSTPNVFSHCLIGGDLGGGSLVFGEVVEQGITYSPLVPSESHYHLNLLSISVGGQTVPIDPKVFATSSTRGTIVDSGTTLAYLPLEAYYPFISALTAAVPPYMRSYSKDGSQCFQVPSSAKDVFPLVNLNFEGNASMVLKPKEYLRPHFDIDVGVFCIAFQKTSGLTILGELVLKDKVIVYDLGRQRLGWVDFNCSLPLSVSLPSSSSSRNAALYPIAATGFLIYISMSVGFLFFV